MSDIIKVALIGFGGIARMHYAAYRALIADGSAVKVVAVVDKNAAQFKSNMRINLGSVDATLDKYNKHDNKRYNASDNNAAVRYSSPCRKVCRA